LVADEFLADADVIATLRRNEVVLLATMYQERRGRLDDAQSTRSDVYREVAMLEQMPSS
jgi:hypothetical protein